MHRRITFALFLALYLHRSASFTPIPRAHRSFLPCSMVAETGRRMGELTEPEKRVFDIMTEFHDSKYNFRVVVVGKGAILETTAHLGPVTKVTQSPATGANLLTLASEDQSFEFHLQLAEVSKIVLTERETPKRTMRIARFLNHNGEPMCSLILANDSEDAVNWFKGLEDKYGNDIQL